MWRILLELWEGLNLKVRMSMLNSVYLQSQSGFWTFFSPRILLKSSWNSYSSATFSIESKKFVEFNFSMHETVTYFPFQFHFLPDPYRSFKSKTAWMILTFIEFSFQKWQLWFSQHKYMFFMVFICRVSSHEMIPHNIIN